MGVAVPWLEHAVALTVVLLGAVLALSQFQTFMALGLSTVAVAAALHGLAHGAEVPTTGFATYALGFLTTTAVLHAMGVSAALGVRQIMARNTPWIMACLGTVLGGAGVYLASQL
jgi:urease accessory protein